MGDLAVALGGVTGATASVNNSTGNITITAASLNDTITVGGTATGLNFGMHTLSGLPSNQTVIANDVPAFLDAVDRGRRGHGL